MADLHGTDRDPYVFIEGSDHELNTDAVAAKLCDKRRELEQQLASMTPADAMKIAKGLANYGRAEIRIPLSNLFELLAPKNVGIAHVEYDHRAECLCIIVKGDGLPVSWPGARPFVVSGKFTEGSYIMADVRQEWAR